MNVAGFVAMLAYAALVRHGVNLRLLHVEFSFSRDTVVEAACWTRKA
jgi:hypothetical protein